MVVCARLTCAAPHPPSLPSACKLTRKDSQQNIAPSRPSINPINPAPSTPKHNAGKTAAIVGHVWHHPAAGSTTQQQPAGVAVHCYDEDRATNDDLMCDTTTEADGSFACLFSVQAVSFFGTSGWDFGLSRASRNPDVYCLFDGVSGQVNSASVHRHDQGNQNALHSFSVLLPAAITQQHHHPAPLTTSSRPAR